MFYNKQADRNTSTGRRIASLMFVLAILAACLPAAATAQRGPASMWVDRISASHTPGRELAGPLTLNVDVHVTSRAGTVSGADVSIQIFGPAGEQIPARATTGRDGFAQITAQVPGGGPYDVVVMDIHYGGYFYDSNLDTHAFPGYFVLPVGPVFTAENDTGKLFRRIRQFTTEGAFVREWHPTKTTSEPTDYPNHYAVGGLTTDSQGYLYARLRSFAPNTTNPCEVQKYTSYGELVHTVGGVCAAGAGQLAGVGALAVDSHDNLYVVDSGLEIEVFDGGGNHLSTWPLPFPVNDADAVIDLNDDLYLIDIASDPDQIHKFSSSGTYLLSWPLDGAWSIDVNSANQLHVALLGIPFAGADSVNVFTPTGQLITSWTASAGDAATERLGIDANDRVYLSGSNSPNVAKYTSGGAFLLAWDAQTGTSPTKSPLIYDIAIYH